MRGSQYNALLKPIISRCNGRLLTPNGPRTPDYVKPSQNIISVVKCAFTFNYLLSVWRLTVFAVDDCALFVFVYVFLQYLVTVS